MSDGASPVVVTENPDGSGPFVIICDHASNRIPAEYEPIGLSAGPWQIGIVFGDDPRLADWLIHGLRLDPALSIGINQPYSPADEVYYTVERHARRWRLPAAWLKFGATKSPKPLDSVSGRNGWGICCMTPRVKSQATKR
jgi:predicted N-formylglutamate amidohydrolase